MRVCVSVCLAVVAVSLSIACTSSPPPRAPEPMTVPAAHFATVFNAVLDATERRYPAYVEDARAGRVATAWHVYQSVYTDRTFHHSAWNGSWKPPVGRPGLYVRMRVHVIGAPGAWQIVIVPQASHHALGASPRVITGVPSWLAVEADRFRRLIESSVRARAKLLASTET